MFKKIKNLLGIEGVKIELSCPSELPKTTESIKGKIKLSSKSIQIVEGITIKLIEKYKRGRKESALINEYLSLIHI